MRLERFLICTFVAIAAALVAPAQAGKVRQPIEMPGAVIYRQRCQGCHAAPSQRAVLAPPLAGIIGRRSADTPFNYSAALRRSGIIWTRAQLDHYIAAPSRTVPGTRMLVGLGDAKQRAELIDYLASQ